MDQASTALRPFDRQAQNLRLRFEAELTTLPRDCAEIALRVYRERVERSHERRLLGEYAPWLVADLLRYDEGTVVESAVAWLYIYLAVIMIDDHLDLAPQSRNTDMIVASLLVQRGVTKALRLCDFRDQRTMADALQLAFQETATAGLHEMNDHRTNASPYSSEEVQRTGKKLSMLRICALSLVAAQDAIKDADRLDGFLEFFAVGIQLLDDLADFEEDYVLGSWTLPLTQIVAKGYATDASGHARIIGRSELLALLIASGGLEDTLKAAITNLRSARRRLRTLSPTSTAVADFLDSLLVAAGELLTVARRVRLRTSRRQVGVIEWSHAIDPADLIDIERRIRVVGQYS